MYRPHDDLSGQKASAWYSTSLYARIESKVLCLGFRLIRQHKLELTLPALEAFTRKSLDELTFLQVSDYDAGMNGLGHSPKGMITSSQEDLLNLALPQILLANYSDLGFSDSQRRKARRGFAKRWLGRSVYTDLARVHGMTAPVQARELKVSERTIFRFRKRLKQAAQILLAQTLAAAAAAAAHCRDLAATASLHPSVRRLTLAELTMDDPV